jgi:hypothetical protein
MSRMRPPRHVIFNRGTSACNRRARGFAEIEIAGGACDAEPTNEVVMKSPGCAASATLSTTPAQAGRQQPQLVDLVRQAKERFPRLKKSAGALEGG